MTKSRGELGVRIKDMDKPLLCGKTAKDYKFWDNLMYHYKNLYPMYDKKVDFKTYTRSITLTEPYIPISLCIFALKNIKPEMQISKEDQGYDILDMLTHAHLPACMMAGCSPAQRT